MKVNFKNITYYPTLDGKEPKTEDLSGIIAEAIYQNAANFAEHKLAHRIAESEDLELTPQEVSAVKRAISGFRFFVQKPILERLGEKFD